MLRHHSHRQPTRLGRRAAWTVAVLATACLAVAGLVPLHSAANQQEGKTGLGAKGKATADRHGDPLPAGARARLGTTRLRHGADVTFVAFGPDGKTLLTAGEDNTIRLWDLAGGKEMRRFARPKRAGPAQPAKGQAGVDKKVEVDMVLDLMAGGRNAANFNVALAPNGKTLAASGSGNVIQLWDAPTGKELRQIQGPPSGLAGLLFSPDSRTLAARTTNGTIFLWAADTGKEIRRIKPPPPKAGNTIVLRLGGRGSDAPGMAFTPDGKVLAAAVTVRNQNPAISAVKFWDIASGQEVRQIKAPEGASVSAVAFTPDGKLLAFGAGSVVRLCQVDTGKEVRQLKTPDGGFRALVFSPDGSTLAALARNQRVRLWQTATGKELQQLGDAEPPPRPTGGLAFVSSFTAPEARALTFSPDGKQMASAAGSTVRLWETATGKELPLLDGHRKALSAITLSADGKVVVSWGADRVIRRWEAATGRTVGTFPAPPRTTQAAFSADGRTVALANADNTIRLHEAATGKELHRLKGQSGALALAFAADGKVLAVRESANNTIRLYDVARGVELRQITMRPGNNPAPGGVLVIGGSGRGARSSGPGLAFSPDGKLLVAPRSGTTLVFCDVTTAKELRKIKSPRAVTSFAFSPDGRTLATENADRTITLWEVASGKQRGQFGTPVAPRPQPNAGMMGVVLLVDGIDGRFSDPAGPVRLTFSPDGRALAARGPDRSVSVWDVTAGKELGQFKGHSGRIETVAFAPDGKTLASGASDTTILLWDATGPMKNLSKPPAVELPATALEALWSDLAGDDSGRAFQSMLELAGAPAQAVAFLGQRLKPAMVVDPHKIDRWIADLGSETFAVRQEAAANLLKTGAQAVPALKKALASAPPLETRRRAEKLVEGLTSGTLTADELRLIRALEALERMDTPPARLLLRTLAEGAAGALPTREAQAALDRLAK